MNILEIKMIQKAAILLNLYFLMLLWGGFQIMAMGSFQGKLEEVKVDGRILFISDRDESLGLYLLDNGEIKKIYSDVLGASWSPDGKDIVCVSLKDGIFIIDQSGKFKQGLIKQKGSLFNNPSFSPDGQRVIFESTLNNNSKMLASNLFFIDRNGSNLLQLTHEADIRKDFSYPIVSPNGKYILFSKQRDPNDYNSRNVVYVMNKDGTNIVKLTDNPNADIHPTWSPDGKSIAFGSMREGDDFRQIYVMDTNGQNIKRITTSKFAKAEPCFSPDGTRICYIGYRRNLPFAYSELFVVNLDGTGEALLLEQIKVGKVWSTDQHPKWTK